MEEEFIVVWN